PRSQWASDKSLLHPNLYRPLAGMDVYRIRKSIISRQITGKNCKIRTQHAHDPGRGQFHQWTKIAMNPEIGRRVEGVIHNVRLIDRMQTFDEIFQNLSRSGDSLAVCIR